MRTQWMTLSRLSVPMSVMMMKIVMAFEPLHPLQDSASYDCVCLPFLDHIADIFPECLSLHCESFVEVSVKCKCCSIWLERGHIASQSIVSAARCCSESSGHRRRSGQPLVVTRGPEMVKYSNQINLLSDAQILVAYLKVFEALTFFLRIVSLPR